MHIFKVLLLTLFLTSSSFAQTVGKQLEYNSAWGVDAKSNLIKNPSAAKNAQFATTSSASVARGTTNKIDNKASWNVDASAQNGFAEFTLISGDADSISGNCEFKGIFLGDGSLYKAQILDGSSNVLAQTVTLTNESNWRAFSVNYPCAAVASRKVRITQTEAGTAPAVSFGKLYYGAATNIGSAVPPNVFSAQVLLAGGISSQSNPSLLSGSCSVSDTSLYSCPLVSGQFTLFPYCTVTPFAGTSSNATAYIVDVSTTQVQVRMYNGSTKTATEFFLSCRKRGADAAQSAISPNDWSYNWTSYTPTITALSGSLTNFTLSETEHRRDNEGKLWIRGKLTFTGSPGTWNTPRVSLPSGLVIAKSDFNLGAVIFGDTGTNSFGGSSTVGSGNSFASIVTLGGVNGAGLAMTQASPFTWAATDDMQWNIGPIDIVGWNNSQSAPQLLGSITANTNSAIRFESFKSTSVDCTASPCVADATASNTGGIAVTRTATGQYTATFTPAFGTAPICVVNPSRGGSGHICEMSSTTTAASTSFVCSVSNTSATVVDTRFNLFCFGFR